MHITRFASRCLTAALLILISVGAGARSARAAPVDLSVVDIADIADIRDNQEFVLGDLPAGLNRLRAGDGTVPGKSPDEVVLLIHGINEPGSTWTRVLRKLTGNPNRLVYLYHWSKWTPIHVIQRRLGETLNALIAEHGGHARKLTVVAHSAGGVLLLKSLCYVPGSTTCVYRPQGLGETRLAFHTVASPLGGYGFGLGAKASGLFAGAVFGLMGQRISYADSVASGHLKIWYTFPENDANVKVSPTFDNRFPEFTDTPLAYAREALPDDTHVGAVSTAIFRIFGF